MRVDGYFSLFCFGETKSQNIFLNRCSKNGGYKKKKKKSYLSWLKWSQLFLFIQTYKSAVHSPSHTMCECGVKWRAMYCNFNLNVKPMVTFAVSLTPLLIISFYLSRFFSTRNVCLFSETL